MGRGWQGKTAGGFGFALNFLWLLSLFQDKESDNANQLAIMSFIRNLHNKKWKLQLNKRFDSLECCFNSQHK